jgi:uncharacterized protein YodC (DUF2158 family)
MAITFKKGDAVKVNTVVPAGPIQAFRMDEDGIVYCLLAWVDVNGQSQTRWFLENELVAA